jgi:hypothetical protein
MHFAARVSATGTSAAFRESFLLSEKKDSFFSAEYPQDEGDQRGFA